jgi:8-oxo-dGTP diphosphatase
MRALNLIPSRDPRSGAGEGDQKVVTLMNKQPIQVSVGVIQNPQQEVLLSQRHQHLHQGGKWEFVGGKVEAHEISRQALTRELYEELGIIVQRAQPLIRIHHDYGDKQVILDVWQVTEFNGEPHGREGQAIRWVPKNELLHYDFPTANYPIINAVRLPRHYLITSGTTEEKVCQQITEAAQKNYHLIRVRAAGWTASHYEQAIPNVAKLCKQYNIELIIDNNPAYINNFQVAGLHLNSQQLCAYQERPISKDYWLAVSCHNENELAQAKKIDADFAVLSPVLPTPSHPEANGLGWPTFLQLIDKVNFPVYALGGMTISSPAAWFGAQGISGLRILSR